MADIEFDDFDAGADPRAVPMVATLTSWAGGAVSLALVAGLVVWGYQIMVRDVTGVPVVRALDGPMRVAPDDPGGTQAEHQGLAVNRVAALGDAAPPADTLRLAPRPVSLIAEDQPRAALRPTRRAELRALPTPDPITAPAALAGDAAQAAIDPALDAAAADPATADDVLAALSEADADLGALDTATAPRDLPAGALAHSPRPLPRPDEDLAARAAIASASAALSPVPLGDLDPAQIIAGTALVQLGAFDDTDQAHAAWDGLSSRGRFAEFFDQKARVVQQAESGGRVFYRLRAAGFDDIADARRFCAALLAEGADCIPVVAR
ncbi:MAG: SPOR domain-containing protein [Rhodobacteraceae bacterium]|nr:SPOR domain-containing protein [Paracoccaceae bacterium]